MTPLGVTPHFGTPNFVKFYLFFIFTCLKNFFYLVLKVKKFEFWRAHLGDNPPGGIPIFVRFSLF